MKLHLPKLLRHAVLTCVAAVAGVTTTAGTATVAGGVVTYTMLGAQALADEYTVNTSASPANGDTAAPANNIDTYTAEDTIIFDLNGGYLKMANMTINAQVVINRLKINDGSGNKTYTFANTVTGTGDFSFVATSTAKGQTYHFQGSMAGYSGNMLLNDDRASKFIFSAESGTGAINAMGTNRVVVDGATILNSSINTALLEVTKLGSAEGPAITTVGSSSVASQVTASALTIAANSGLHMLAGTTLTLGSAISNAGSLTLDGTLAVETLDNWSFESTGSLSNGTHGYRTGELKYTLVTSAGDAAALQLGDSFALMVGDTAIDRSSLDLTGSTLKYVQSGSGTMYEISSEYNEAAPVTYAGSTGDMEQATGFRLADGTTLRLTSTLAESVIEGIWVTGGGAATVEVLNNGDTETVLQAGSLHLETGASLVLKGDGVYRNDAVTTAASVLPGGVSLSADEWTGTLELAGGSQGVALDTYVNSHASAVRLNGLLTYVQNQTVTKDIELVNNADGWAVRLNNGTSTANQSGTFSGAVSGTGNMEYTWNSGGTNVCSSYVFSGNVSAWDGWFVSGANAGKMVEARFTSGGDVFSSAGNGGVKDNRTSDYRLKVTIEAESTTNFNGSIVNAQSVAVNSNTIFKKNINAVSMTVADGVEAVLDNGTVLELDTLAGTVSSDGGTITLGSVAAETSATIAGSNVAITGTIANSGSLDITAGTITLNEDLSAYTIKAAGSTAYSLGNENGFQTTMGGSYYLVEGGTVTISATQADLGGEKTNITCDTTGAWFNSNTTVESTLFYVSNGEVEVTDDVLSKATRYVLNGGTMKVTNGSVDAALIDTTAVSVEGIITSGGVKLESAATLTGLTTAAHGNLIAATTGNGTIEVTVANDWNTTIATNEAFTGTTYVAGGSRFTYNSEGLGSTLKLASGVNMQVNNGGYLADNLVLEEGNHEIHINGSTTFEITGTISGEGTFDKRGGNSSVYIKENASVENYKAGAGTTYIQDAATVNHLTVASNTNISGGTINDLTVTGATTTITGGSIGTLAFNGGTLNTVSGSGDSAVSGILNVTGTLTVAATQNGLNITGATGETKVGSLVLTDTARLNIAGSLTMNSVEYGALGAGVTAASLLGEQTEIHLTNVLQTAGVLTEAVTLLTLTNASDCQLIYDGQIIGTAGDALTLEQKTQEGDTHQYSLAWNKNALTLSYLKMIEAPLEWNTDNSVWENDSAFDSDPSKPYEPGKSTLFTAENTDETVQVKGELATGDITIAAGADGSYTFTSHNDGGQISTAAKLTVESGTADFQVGDLTVSGRVTNNGTLKTDAALSAKGVVENNGTMTIGGELTGVSIINNGSLTVGSLSSAYTQTTEGAALEITTEDATVGYAEIADGSVRAHSASWALSHSTLGTGVVIETSGDNAITLTDSSLSGKIDTQDGTLILDGTITISADYADKSTLSKRYTDGENGYENSVYEYLIADGGAETTDNIQWNVLTATRSVIPSPEYNAETGILSVFDAMQTTDYYVNSGKVTYHTSFTKFSNATGLVLNGGTLALESALASGIEGIRVDAKGGDLTIGTSVTGNVEISGSDAENKVTIKGNNSSASLALDKLTAELALTGTHIAVGSDVTLTGTLTDGILQTAAGTTVTCDGFSMNDSSLRIEITPMKGNVLNQKQIQSAGTDGLATLKNISKLDEDRIVIGSTINGNFVETDVYNKYFNEIFMDDSGKVLATGRNSSYYSDKVGESTSTHGAIGLAMANAALEKLNPQADNLKKPGTNALGVVLDQLDEYVTSGNTAAADELGASLAGASTAVLGMAAISDVDRQLKAIRNRTTTMGVDQSIVHDYMPYFNAWINAEGNNTELSANGTESGYKLNSWGGTVGFDVDCLPTLTAGMALTAMYGDLDADGAGSASGDLNTYYLSAFARYTPSAWSHVFAATFGLSDISLNRTVAGVESEGETDGMSFGLMYEVGRVIALEEDCTTCLQPVFNISWRYASVDAYREKGTNLALDVDEQSLNTVTLGLGARMQSVVGESVYNRSSILEARVLVKADIGDRCGSTDVAMSSLSDEKVSLDSAEMGAVGLEAGAGLTIPLNGTGSSIFMDAAVELRSDYTNVNGTVGYRMNF